jgi:hypothetical protein
MTADPQSLPLLPPRLDFAHHALNMRHRARLLFRRAGRQRRRIPTPLIPAQAGIQRFV